MKNTGICPQCGSHEIYTNEKLTKTTDRGNIRLSTWKIQSVSQYLCLGCGFLLEYAEQNSFDEANKQKIREKWSKVDGRN